MALGSIRGAQLEQFENLRAYGKVVLLSNPRSTIVIKAIAIQGGEATVFESIFVDFGSIAKGLFSGCRKINGLDRCHLKTSSGGVLLSAISRDPKFPITRCTMWHGLWCQLKIRRLGPGSFICLFRD